jgi:hypothetical protein
MRAAPIGRRGVVPVAVAVALPVIAVFATQVPLRQLAAKLLVPRGL